MSINETRKRASENISANIRKYRVLQHMSQKKLAKSVGVNQSTVARIESGDRHMLAEELVLYAEALGVSIYELLN